jgi:transglutaminase-like putative cysteine protease
MTLPSRHVEPEAVRAWAEPSFAPDRPLVDVVVDLAHRICAEFAYRSGATTVTTTQAQLLDRRAGVCQDFAHLMIAALRDRGLPARYASGYLETRPRPGRPKQRGADASHAWVSAWIPGHGWLEVDPTNDVLVDDRYVVLGWGRDYDDVPPLRGVIETQGTPARPQVEVDLVPAGSEPFV